MLGIQSLEFAATHLLPGAILVESDVIVKCQPNGIGTFDLAVTLQLAVYRLQVGHSLYLLMYCMMSSSKDRTKSSSSASGGGSASGSGAGGGGSNKTKSKPHKCEKCKASVAGVICCDRCVLWHCTKCAGIESDAKLALLMDKDITWFYAPCRGPAVQAAPDG